MERQELEHYYQLLIRRRNEILQRRDPGTGRQAPVSLRDSTAELSIVDNHPADVASENYERGKDLSLQEKDRLLVEEIDAALERIYNGSFGLCSACGQEIDRERLEALPYAEHCRSCRALLEGGRGSGIRPVEEELLYPPYARSFRDDSDYTAYDGEDAWQDAARHNKRPNYYDDDLDEEEAGVVEETDRISNQQYRDQLPD